MVCQRPDWLTLMANKEKKQQIISVPRLNDAPVFGAAHRAKRKEDRDNIKYGLELRRGMKSLCRA